jgi:hypothetical protein
MSRFLMVLATIAVLEPLIGMYVGGVRVAATARAYRSVLVLERQGEAPVFAADQDLVDARPAPALAGKVMGEGGLLVICGPLGDAVLDTGFRSDDKSRYPEWTDAVKGLVSS